MTGAVYAEGTFHLPPLLPVLTFKDFGVVPPALECQGKAGAFTALSSVGGVGMAMAESPSRPGLAMALLWNPSAVCPQQQNCAHVQEPMKQSSHKIPLWGHCGLGGAQEGCWPL